MSQTVRSRIRLGVAAMAVLAAALFYHRSALPKREMLRKGARMEVPAEVDISAHPGLRSGAEQQQNGAAGLPVGSNQEDARVEARGTGYVWGTALRVLFASARISADGAKELDVSNLKRSYQGFRRPVDLEEASASPTIRAEYLAATITAALDRPTSEQPLISRSLERYYAADFALRELDEAVVANERSRLSREARSELEALLPVDARGEFGQLFASPTFLFVTMCATADRIYLQMERGTMISTGNATFTIGGDNKFTVTASAALFSAAPPPQNLHEGSER